MTRTEIDLETFNKILDRFDEILKEEKDVSVFLTALIQEIAIVAVFESPDLDHAWKALAIAERGLRNMFADVMGKKFKQ